MVGARIESAEEEKEASAAIGEEVMDRDRQLAAEIVRIVKHEMIVEEVEVHTNSAEAAIAALLSRVRGEGWVSVKERLPEKQVDVWVWQEYENGGGTIKEAWLMPDGRWNLHHPLYTITHWRPEEKPPVPPPEKEASDGR